MDWNQFFLGKNVLVTGSGRGIGQAIALHFATLGADLVINYFRHRVSAEETAAKIQSKGRKAITVKANIGNLEGVRYLIEETERYFGALDIIIHNAASGYNHPFVQQKPRGWEWTMNINTRSFLFLTQYALPLLKKNGASSIVAISSPGALRVLPDYIVVGASKAALEAIVRYLAVELAQFNINVNAVSPGVVLTDALKHFETIQKTGTIENTTQLTPAGRLTTPEDIAGVVAFLCTPMANMIRGQVIAVDGGITLLGQGVYPPQAESKQNSADLS